ncbi:MAG: hypothetical protein QXJ07_04450 [Candidatus Bathyarchaeia archaeon]
MPVRIRTKDRLQGSATPTVIGEEVLLIELGNQTDDYIVEGHISLQNLQASDIVRVNCYYTVDGFTLLISDSITVGGEQEVKAIRIPAITLPYNAKFRVGLTQLAGEVRSFPYAFIVQVMEQI